MTVLDLHENWPDVMSYHLDYGVLSFFQCIAARLTFWPRYEKACLQQADHVIVTARGMKERITNVGIPPDKISIVMNLEDVNYFLSLPVRNEIINKYRDDFVLSYVGKLTFERGIQSVIHAVRLLMSKIPNLRFLIVGDGPDEDKFKEMCYELGVGEVVEFTGWVDLESVRSYILSTDVGVLPQIVNQQTNLTSAHKVFQYMAVGKPIITTPTQVYKEINEEREFALFVPYNDPKSLSEAIMRLYNDDSLRLRLGENGRRLTREKYDWKFMERNFVDIYSRI